MKRPEKKQRFSTVCKQRREYANQGGDGDDQHRQAPFLRIALSLEQGKNRLR